MARRGKFVIKTGRGGKTHFVVIATNGRVVATSETFESNESCLKGIAAVNRLAADATVIEDSPAPSGLQPKRKAKGARVVTTGTAIQVPGTARSSPAALARKAVCLRASVRGLGLRNGG